MSHPDPQGYAPVGDVDELQQRDADTELPIPAVPVHVDGPVPVQSLPSRSGGAQSYTLPGAGALAGRATRVGKEDPRRRRMILMLTTAAQTFCFGVDQASAESGIAAAWPTGVPLLITWQDALWIRAGAGVDVSVTVVSEFWAD